jgi:Ribonuclease G/E
MAFPGGVLRVTLTPAMTLIDVDGEGAPETLAVEGARAAAQAIRRLGLAGSIGIDLPTVAGAARQAAAHAIDAALPPPFERTAVNGFGFVQIVRPRLRASLSELFVWDATAAQARALLRRAEHESIIGGSLLTASPEVIAVLRANPAWLATLAQNLGGAVTLRADAGLAIAGGYASQAC